MKFSTFDEIKIFIGCLLAGLVVGYFANLAMFIFNAFVLGWGDSAPNWFFRIQDQVHYGNFVASIALVYWYVRFRPVRTTNEEPNQPLKRDEETAGVSE
jgi:hypothetical protein